MRKDSPLAVVLAAGASRRMGRNKALLDWDGHTLLQAHLSAIPCAAVVVTGAGAERLRPLLGTAHEVHNPRFASTTMGQSVVLGLGEHPGPALIMPIDTVPQPQILEALLGRPESTVPLAKNGDRGHPVWVSSADVLRLKAQTDPNLRDLLMHAMTLPTQSLTCALDFDTPQALERVREVMGNG